MFLLATVFFVLEKVFLLVPKFSAEKQVDKRLELVLNGEMEKELIVLGSSRGARNIIAEVVEENTDFKSYNLSYPGSNVAFHEFILKTLLRHNNAPKILVLALDERSEFKNNKSFVFRNDRLYPLVGYQDVVNELITQDEKSKLAKYFAVARLQQSNFDFSQKHFSINDSLTICGSMPVYSKRISDRGRKRYIKASVYEHCWIM